MGRQSSILKRERWPSKSPPPLSSNPEPKATGIRDFARLIKEGAAQRAQDTFLFLLGLRQEDTPLVLAKRGGGGPDRVSSEKQPWPRRQLVHAARELTEQSTPRGPG